MYQTDVYEGLLAETIVLPGYHGDRINAYFARPLGAGPFPGLVLIHHMPGWDEWYKEITCKFARQGYATLCPNLYFRAGHGTPEDVAAKVRATGGVPDEQVLGDVEGALRFLSAAPTSNGKVGIFGTCSGGRHAYLAACRLPGFAAVIDCWGGRVVMKPEDLSPAQPVAPLDYTQDLSCPLLGLFGADDLSPTPEQVDRHEQELKKYKKNYEFHVYPGAGHGFFYHHRPMYRQEQAVDGWNKVFAFFEKISQNNRRMITMCTMIAQQVKIDGSGKGTSGWFALREANVSYDHPYSAPYEYALNLDFVNESQGPGARVAVELSLEAAQSLLETIQAVLARAEAGGFIEKKVKI